MYHCTKEDNIGIVTISPEASMFTDFIRVVEWLWKEDLERVLVVCNHLPVTEETKLLVEIEEIVTDTLYKLGFYVL